jgi:peroxiredoxin
MTLVAALFLLPGTSFAILQKGQAAPDFKITSTAGKPLTLAGLKGKVLILDFFATWCPPCRDSIPHLMELQRTLGANGLQVVGMSMDDGGIDVVKSFVDKKQLTYPVALINEDLGTEYGIRSIPTIYVISKKGVVAEKFLGYNPEVGKAMDALVKRLLAE